jgi:hypothetical protein
MQALLNSLVDLTPIANFEEKKKKTDEPAFESYLAYLTPFLQPQPIEVGVSTFNNQSGNVPENVSGIPASSTVENGLASHFSERAGDQKLLKNNNTAFYDSQDFALQDVYNEFVAEKALPTEPRSEFSRDFFSDLKGDSSNLNGFSKSPLEEDTRLSGNEPLNINTINRQLDLVNRIAHNPMRKGTNLMSRTADFINDLSLQEQNHSANLVKLSELYQTFLQKKMRSDKEPVVFDASALRLDSERDSDNIFGVKKKTLITNNNKIIQVNSESSNERFDNIKGLLNKNKEQLDYSIPFTETPVEAKLVAVTGVKEYNLLPVFDLFSDIVDQLGSFIQKEFLNGSQEFTFQLNPKNLGAIKVQMMTEGNNVTVKIETTEEDVKKVLYESLESLKQNLSENEIHLTHFDIQVIEPKSQNTSLFQQDIPVSQFLFDQQQQSFRQQSQDFEEQNEYVPTTQNKKNNKNVVNMNFIKATQKNQNLDLKV